MKLSDKLRHDNESGDFDRALEGYAEEAEKLENAEPKIKMKKALPTEDGNYYWSMGKDDFPEIGNIGKDGEFYIDDKYYTPSLLGGYWAKADISNFEFED